VSNKALKLSDQIRRAVDASGLSHNAICKALNINKGAMSRFMHGKVGMTTANLDRLAGLLRLEIKKGRSSERR
jgi:transcriptional regulator with XRE-family HTH domain